MVIAASVLVSLVIGFYLGRRFENRVVVTAMNMLFKSKKEKTAFMQKIKKRAENLSREN